MGGITDLVFQLDPERKITFANPAFENLGYTSEDLEGQIIDDLIAERDRQALVSILSEREAKSLIIRDIKTHFISKKDSSEVMYSLDAFGVWDIPHDVVFQSEANKNFLGTLCIGKSP